MAFYCIPQGEYCHRIRCEECSIVDELIKEEGIWRPVIVLGEVNEYGAGYVLGFVPSRCEWAIWFRDVLGRRHWGTYFRDFESAVAVFKEKMR